VGDSSLNGKLFVVYDASLNSRLVVGSDVTVNKRLFTVGDSSLNGNLFVGKDASLNSRLVVGSDVTVNKRLFTLGDVSFNNGNLFVGLDTSLNGNLVIGKDLTIKGRLNVQNYTNNNIINTTVNNYQLIVSEDLSLNGTLNVSQNANLNGNVYMKGNVGIGTTAPTHALDVSGTIRANSTNQVYNKLLVLYDNNTSETLSSATNFMGFGISNSTLRYQVPNSVTAHIFYSGGTELLKVGESATTLVTGMFASGSSNTLQAVNGTPGVVYMRTPGNFICNNAYVYSDKRIKYNIHDRADIPFLELLRYLKPRIFNYIDEMQNGTEPVWGFIAQEVAEVMPTAVTYDSNYIPNIYEVAEIVCTQIKLGNKTTTELLTDENGYYPLKIKNTKGQDIIVNITEIIDEKTFKIDQEIETEYNKVFVYGQEIPDFHGLDKDQIFTVTTAAVQEIDKELQETKNRLQLLEEENQNLKQQNVLLNEKIKNIEDRLSKNAL
jgi:predicted acyltransferase (DUF342 family)